MTKLYTQDATDLGPRVTLVIYGRLATGHVVSHSEAMWAVTDHPASSHGFPVLIKPIFGRDRLHDATAQWDRPIRPGDVLAMVNDGVRPLDVYVELVAAVVLTGDPELGARLQGAGYTTVSNAPADLALDLRLAYAHLGQLH